MRFVTRSFFVVAAVALLCAPVAMAQLAPPDFAVTGVDSVDPVQPGQAVSYTFTVSNVGSGTTTNEVILDLRMPIGIPAGVADYENGVQEAVDAYTALSETVLASDNLFNDNTGIFWGVDGYCEQFLLQFQGLVLPPGTSGDVEFTFPAPEATGDGIVHVTSANLDADLVYGRGACSTTAETCAGIPCMGPRVSAIDPPIVAPVQLVDDGTGATGSLGCGSLAGFTPGNIAMVDRGTCTFEAKALNALLAGASAVIIADNSTSTVTGFPDGITNMSCTDFCSAALMTIPVVFVSYNNALALHADLATGITGTIGRSIPEPMMMAVDALIWENVTNGADTNAANDTWNETTLISSEVVDAPVASFTFAAADLMVTFTDTSTNAPTSWAWDFGDGGSSTEQNPTHTYATSGTFTVAMTATNAGGSSSATADVTVTAPVVDPPVASFTYVVDQLMATFTDTSTNVPTSWAWDFGDGATSALQNPTHTYAAAGTYTVSLAVHNDGGFDDFTMDVTVTADVTLDNLYYIPAAAKAEGNQGSFFVSDLTVNNAGTTMATYAFLWLPRGTDNSTPAQSTTSTLAAGEAVVIADVLGTAFGVDDGAVGALAVASDSDDLLLMSRTYNLTDNGTFGQSIPGYAASDLIPANMRQRILFFVENDDFRTNLGLMNGTGAAIRIQWERFTADGTSVETGFSDLPPWGNIQLNSVFSDEKPVNGGYVDVWTETTGGAFAAYGSLLDNETSDPTTVLPQ